MNIKIALYWFVLIVGALCLLDAALLLLKGLAMHVGTLSLLIIGVSFVLFGYLKIFKKVQIIKNKTISRIAAVCIGLLFISFVAVETLIWTGAKDESATKVDYVVLLGAGLQGDKIPVTFRNRIDKCVSYMESNVEAKVVVSGGQGNGETITEAEAMKKYLMENGIAQERIYEENQATSTYENLTFSKEILDQASGGAGYTVLIATNDFHLFRAKMLADSLGLQAYGMPAKTWWGAFPSNCIREYFAVLKMYLLEINE